MRIIKYIAALLFTLASLPAPAASYWQSSGGFGTPNCSSGNYWATATGTFSTPTGGGTLYWSSSGGTTAPSCGIAIGPIGTGTVISGSETNHVTTTGITTSTGDSFYFGVVMRPITEFTATIASTVMTVTAVSAGTISVGMIPQGANITYGTTITSFGSGTGGTGTYNLSASSTVGTGETVYGIPTVTVTDSKSNSYTQIGTAEYETEGPPNTILRFECTDCTGGSAHTATMTAASGTIASWTGFFVDIQGAASSMLVDQSAVAQSYATQPFNAGTVTITPPSGNEAVICILTNTEYPGTTMTVANYSGGSAATWTLGGQEYLGTYGNPPQMGISTAVVSANGNYGCQYTTTAGSTGNVAMTLDSLKGP